jgi:hypothetical protein
MQMIKAEGYPARRWLLGGYPDSGKSTFSTQMTPSLVVIDAANRYDEVATLAPGDVYRPDLRDPDGKLSPLNPLNIFRRMEDQMPEMGQVGTVILDSWTEVMRPYIDGAMLSNTNGENTSKAAAFVEKANASRMLLAAVSRWQTDTLLIHHLYDGRDHQAKTHTSSSIPKEELQRLILGLNARLTMVADKDKRGIKIDWSRNGRFGITLWDDVGFWRGMPERIESAMYDGGGRRHGSAFSSKDAAIAWAVDNGSQPDTATALSAYDALKTKMDPKTSGEMFDHWVLFNV